MEIISKLSWDGMTFWANSVKISKTSFVFQRECFLEMNYLWQKGVQSHKMVKPQNDLKETGDRKTLHLLFFPSLPIFSPPIPSKNEDISPSQKLYFLNLQG